MFRLTYQRGEENILKLNCQVDLALFLKPFLFTHAGCITYIYWDFKLELDTNNFSLLSSRHCRLSCAVNFRDLCSARELYSSPSTHTDFQILFCLLLCSRLIHQSRLVFHSSFADARSMFTLSIAISLSICANNEELVCINSVYQIQFINYWYERVQEFSSTFVLLEEVACCWKVQKFTRRSRAANEQRLKIVVHYQELCMRNNPEKPSWSGSSSNGEIFIESYVIWDEIWYKNNSNWGEKCVEG